MGRLLPKKANSRAPASDVNGYLVNLPKDVRVVLQRLRAAIKSAAPRAEESISYRIPAYKYHGHLVFFAAFKNHCSFFVASKSIPKTFSSELSRYDVAGATIHFTVDNPLSAALVKRIVRARIRENEARASKRGKI